jgi:hypothetical protein
LIAYSFVSAILQKFIFYFRTKYSTELWSIGRFLLVIMFIVGYNTSFAQQNMNISIHLLFSRTLQKIVDGNTW